MSERVGDVLFVTVGVRSPSAGCWFVRRRRVVDEALGPGLWVWRRR